MQIKCRNCSVGCMLTIENGIVTGNRCPRGLSYTNGDNKSIFYTMIKLKNASIGKLSVKSDRGLTDEEKEISGELLSGIILEPPIEAGSVVVKNLGNRGINFIAQRKVVKGK